jgi:tRNA (cytidine32/guanosine34-2'-O)-methyltransferase
MEIEKSNDDNNNAEIVDINEKDKTAFKNISYSKRDIYYRKAKEEGFRARSVYKLKEINDNYKILEGATKIVDLCAAPGSWSQMLRILTKHNKDAKIVSVDIQDIVPIEGVKIVKGDITKQETIAKILSHFDNEKVDVVIFDGAPDVTGLIEIDMYMQVQLIIFALIICIKVIKNGGKFVAKVFKVEAKESDSSVSYSASLIKKVMKSDFYYEKVKILFDNIHYFKPSSSRNTSHETFIICEGFGMENEKIQQMLSEMNIEEIFNYNSITDPEVKSFLKFLCEGCYNF